MLKIDMIIPFFTLFNKLTRKNPLRIGHFQYFFPVWYYKKRLYEMGLKVRFLDLFHLKHRKLSKIVGLSPLLPYVAANFKEIIRKLRKTTNYIIWFEQTDGPGGAHLPVLPYVDKYYRSALYKDLSIYKRELFKLSYFVDYYVNNYKINVGNQKPYGYHFDLKFKHKMGVSWNFAICDYRHSTKLGYILNGFTRKYKLNFFMPSKDRKLLFSANYNIMQGFDLVYYQRQRLLDFLNKKYKSYTNVSIGRVPKKEFLESLRTSKAIFSPYGWGELCFRDFEAFFSGGALIKPDMEHLETWPPLYKKDETYISIPWKIEEWDEIIPEILSDDEKLYRIAKNGQNHYRRLWTKEGRDKFCERFIEMVTPT